MGTERIIPIGARTHPQKTIERKTTSVDKLRPLPISFGSMILPTTICTTTKPRTVRRADPTPNWTRARRTTGQGSNDCANIRHIVQQKRERSPEHRIIDPECK